VALEEFFSKESRARAKTAVETIESQTAGEIVVVVRKRCGSYREAELIGALVSGFSMLLWVLFYPSPYTTAGIPLRVLIAGGAGAALVSWLSPLKRAIVSKEKQREAARAAARTSFVDLGVTKTKGRTGVLVLVAAFEKRAEIVCDIGVDASVVSTAAARMQAAVERFDFAAFVTALESMGPPLSKALPRQADDVNELSDEVQ
jgi:putative membrane protein